VMGAEALPAWQKESELPAVVRWEQADAFCEEFGRLLEEKTGRQWECRLPREAEWEYAACYGQPPWLDWWPEGRLHSNHYNLLDHAWYEVNSGSKRHAVGTKEPNPLGLYDMLGNEMEWCDGWLTDSVETMLSEGWKEDYPGTPRPGGRMARDRPRRGGGYLSTEDECRPSRRRGGRDMPTTFRVVALPGR